MQITRRNFIGLAGAAGLAAATSPRIFAANPAESLYRRSLAIDGMGFPGSMDTEKGAALNREEIGHVRESGLTAVQFTVGSVGTEPPLAAFEAIVRDVARWEREIDAHPSVLSRVRRPGDILAAKAEGTTGLVYGLQDGVSFEDDIGRLDALWRIGIRVIQPTYNRRNLLGDGCMEPADAGLSRTGLEAVERIQELGILLDLSHCGRRTAADAIAASTRPPAFTHAGCHALADHPRHRTDEEIRSIAERGGIIGIYIMPYMARGRQPTAADVIDHLEHAIDVGGEDHVALGTDGTVSPAVLTEAYKQKFREVTRKRKEQGIAAPFETEEGYLFAADLNTPLRFESLVEMLLQRGHSESRIEKILGSNLQRVFAEAWNG